MNYFKKLFFYAIFILPMNGLFAQSFPYKAPASNAGTDNVYTGYNLVWSDEFNGTQLDTINNWVVEINGSGEGNNEMEYYARKNISVGPEPVTGAGCLIITAKKESYLGSVCTSGRLKTYGKMSFTHGKIEARIKLPHTANGLWPAFWMMGADYGINGVGWPKCGEMDILEMGNTNGINAGTQDKYFSGWCHWGESYNNGSYPNTGTAVTNSYGLQDDFHLFTVIWGDTISMYLDLDKYPNNKPYNKLAINGADVAGNSAHYFNLPFYVIFNLAIGGNFTGITGNSNIGKITALANGDANMYVDYVRVYQRGVSTETYSGPALVPTGVNEVKQDQYTIYPNPANDHITIQTNNELTRVVFINMAGQEVLSVTNSTSIDTSTLPSGNYLVKIMDRNGNVETHQMTKK
jgi:beta-glucanase (GH16 family)